MSSPSQPQRTIRELRAARGWTQLDVALHLGVHPTMVFRWERGRAVPRRGHQQRLAGLFGIPVGEIACGSGKEQT